MLSRVFTLYFALTLGASGFSQQVFTDVTTNTGIPLPAGSTSIAVGDFNRDGLDDLYVCFVNRKNQLLKNLGNGSFSEVAQSAGVDVDGKSMAAVWGDINNDGAPDLYVANQGANDQLSLNKGDETFQNITLQAGIYQIGNPMAVNMADVNNDGLLDIYVSNFLAENVLYLNMGTTFVNFTWQSGALDSGKSMGAVFFDYDLDGDQDLYLVHDGNQPNFLYQNNGQGVFTEVGQAAGVNTQSFGMGVDAGDIDNDGYPDLYITNLYKNILLRNNGDGTFANISTSADVEDNGMGWGVTFLDYDNDGRQDIYVANDYAFSPYPNVLYRNLGNLVFEQVYTDTALCNKDDSYGTVCFDFNLDGNLDVAVANRGPNEHLQLFQNGGPSGHWIGIKLAGVQSNFGAVGARVLITDDLGVVHVQEVRAGQGWTSQNSNVLHFGLGNAESLQSVTIYWPSGFEQSIDPLVFSLDTYYWILEGGGPMPGLVVQIPNPTRETEILPNIDFSLSPNPYSGGPLVLDLHRTGSSPLQLELFDRTGTLLGTNKLADPSPEKSQYTLALADMLPAGYSGLVLLRLSFASATVTKKVMVALR